MTVVTFTSTEASGTVTLVKPSSLQLQDVYDFRNNFYTPKFWTGGGVVCLEECGLVNTSPGFSSSFNRNEYQEFLLGVKAAGK